MQLEIEPRRLRFRAPLRTAYGTLVERELLMVRIVDGQGGVGMGEAAPLEPYDGASFDAVRAEVEACAELVAGLAEAEPLAAARAACRARCSLPQAAAALDVALWDLEARRAGRPLAALLGDSPAAGVLVNASIAATEPGEAAQEGAAAARAGFRCVKAKVGVGDDVARVAALREAVGPRVAIRADANGAWSVEEAVAALRALAPLGIELCEEPARGVAAIRAVRAAMAGSVPVALDESAREPGALAVGAADAVCLKVAGCGGISGVLRDAATARAAGADVYLASTYDGPIGIAAALHAATALGVARPSGLATLSLFEDVDDPFPPAAGVISLPEGPGLGLPAARA